MRTLDPVALTDGVSTSINLDNGTIGVLIGNESPLAVAVSIGGNSRWLPAWTADYFALPTMITVNGQISLKPKSISSATNSPSSDALITMLVQGDKLEGQYPCSLTRQTNIGNGVVNTAQTNALINDGSTQNTQIVETTPTGETGSAFSLDNMGNLTLRTLDNNVWAVIMQIVQNASGAATKLFHGTSDNVPATGITSGLAGTGVEVGTDSKHKFSMHDLGGYTGTNGIIMIGESVWLVSDTNVGLLYNCYYDGTNYRFLSTGNYAAQILISLDAFGGSVPHFTVRYSTVAGTAGNIITWNAWQGFPTMSDNGGLGGAHIFTGTTTPTGQVAGDLWFNV